MTESQQKHRMNRRRFLIGSGALLGAAVASPLLGGCVPVTETPAGEPPAAPAGEPGAAEPTGAQEVSDFGVPYPEDAAPKEHQYIVRLQEAGSFASMDLAENLYSRPGAVNDFFSEPLARLDNNLNVVPGMAQSWEVADDGLSWTFHLTPGLMWSDGNEVTAEDFVATFRYMADPDHAYDFIWYWQAAIKNMAECAAGELPLEELGVRVGETPYDVVFETYAPTPYLPGMMVYSCPLSKAGLEQYGSGIYNTNPETCISCGPYKLQEWSPDRRFVLVANPDYKGALKPMINTIIATVVSGGDNITRFQAGEVDTINIGTADIQRVMADENLRSLLKTSTGDFRTYYAFFDVTAPPYDDERVRRAFAKAIDRESIVESILAPLALPAYSFLMPGFPDANSEGLKPIQEFDPEAARALLAEAGYPDGQGFPRATLVARGTSADVVPQAVAASISQTLGIEIEVAYKADRDWTADLMARPSLMPFGYVSYGMDYFDATNMLGVWVSGGRHTWADATFDTLVKEGGQITDDMEERSRQMQEAERILVESCAGIYVYHQLEGQLHQPYRKGSHLEPNEFGYDGIQRQQEEGAFGLGFNHLYMGNEVIDIRTVRP